MPITKNPTTKEIEYTAPNRADLLTQTGVANNGNFAICAATDYIKQIKFDPAAQATNTTTTIASGATATDVTLTLPSTSGTLLSTGSVLPTTQGGTGQTAYTTGDVLYASATDTLSKLPIGTSGQVFTSLATGVPAWLDHDDESRYVRIYDDFLINSASLTATVSGADASARVISSTSTAAHPGTYALAVGSTNSGYANLYGSNVDDIIKLGGGITTYETIVNLSALSDGTDTYKTVMGLTTPAYNNTLTITTGIYFSYSSTENSGKWLFNVANSSTTTTQDTGITASTSFVRLGWVLNAGGTSVQAYVNGVAVGSPVTTNIPSSTTALNFQWIIVKSAGTNDRKLIVDAYKYFTMLASAR